MERITLDQVFFPRSVAVVGASEIAGGFSQNVMQALKEADFPRIYPVNPRYTEVMGIKCYPRITDIPGDVDHVIVSIPAEAVLQLMDDCIAKGVRSVHLFTAGFSETGYPERERLEEKMVAKAKAAGIRIIGPNCVGLFCPKSRLVHMTGLALEPGDVAFFSQSGGHSGTLPLDSASRGLRFSKVASYGNAVDVDEVELLRYFRHDPDTRLIAGYIEGVRGGSNFMAALREASDSKPVVIYKAGLTEAGQRGAKGHTASLAGSVEIFAALCRQLGVIQVDDLDELTDMLVAFEFVKPMPAGPGVAAVGWGGGPSVQAAEDIERAGLRLPELPDQVKDELRRLVSVAGTIVSNPVDAMALANPATLLTALQAIARAPQVDILLYHLGFHPVSRWGQGMRRVAQSPLLEATVNALVEAQRTTGKPLIVVLRQPTDVAGMTEFLQVQESCVRAGFPVFYSFAGAAKATARLLNWHRNHGSAGAVA